MDGVIAQLVERLNGIQKVRSSTLLGSTILNQKKSLCHPCGTRAFLFFRHTIPHWTYRDLATLFWNYGGAKRSNKTKLRCRVFYGADKPPAKCAVAYTGTWLNHQPQPSPPAHRRATAATRGYLNRRLITTPPGSVVGAGLGRVIAGFAAPDFAMAIQENSIPKPKRPVNYFGSRVGRH